MAPIKDQLAAEIARIINADREILLDAALSSQEQSLYRAVREIDRVREFVGSPEHILGNVHTKHGEIAEHVEVGIRCAREALEGRETFTATFDDIGRLAPADYIIDGVFVQSKFINGVNNNLDHVLEHLHEYPDFLKGGYYHIPSDTHEAIKKILAGDYSDGLNQNTLAAITEKVRRLEELSGQKFEEVVKPSISRYSEVQQGRIHQTLDNHESQIKAGHNEKVSQIEDLNAPSIAEAGKVAAISAVIGGTVSITSFLYQKHKQGKSIFQLTTEDWKEAGITFGKGAGGGAVTGAAVYALTNCASLSAPMAGAVVSAAKGVGALISDLQQGKIDLEVFFELSLIICGESAIVGLGTYCGQVAIPIPVLGAMVGAVAGQLLANFAREKVDGLKVRIEKEMEKFREVLDAALAKELDVIQQRLSSIEALMADAFNLENNQRLLISSLELARAYGVEEDELIEDHDELDEFMRN